MIIGVDGTGSRLDVDYGREMHNSFVHRLINTCPEMNKQYFRGPALEGLQVGSIVGNALSLIIQWISQGDRRIFLTGYSRGGAAVIRIAQTLKRRIPNLHIECMALFDAVDREIFTDAAVIPGNVHHCYHAMRDDHAGSRPLFDHCGTRSESSCVLRIQKFFATHAGMGGLPWTGDHPTVADFPFDPDERLPRSLPRPIITEAQDRSGSAQVREWMWQNVRQHRMVR